MQADVIGIDDADDVLTPSQKPAAVAAAGFWMRCCAQCSRVLCKSSPYEIVRCICGWEWPA
jgi:hypothetical protein